VALAQGSAGIVRPLRGPKKWTITKQNYKSL